MEDPLAPQSALRRRRVVRKKTVGERIRMWWEMPRLTRRDRNQRIVVAGVIVMLALYLAILRPLYHMIFSAKPAETKATPIVKEENAK